MHTRCLIDLFGACRVLTSVVFWQYMQAVYQRQESQNATDRKPQTSAGAP